MKKMVVYSSKTGNTKKVAYAAAEALNDCEIYDVDSAPDPVDYDFIVMGYWIDKGTADAKALKYIDKIKGKKVFPFMTLGAYPDSDHGKKCVENGKKLLDNNEYMGSFICQGGIAESLKLWMYKLDKDHPHYPNEERIKRWAEADKHPDEIDLENIKQKLIAILNKDDEV